MRENLAWERVLLLRREHAWTVRSEDNPDLSIPAAEYSVRPRVHVRSADAFCGERARVHAAPARAVLAGRLVAPLMPAHAEGKSIAQHMIEWAAPAEATVLPPSCSVEVREPHGRDVRHLGLRVDAMTIAGDAKSGGLSIALDLLGASEEALATSPHPAPDPPAPQPFRFENLRLWLSNDGASEAPLAIESFRLRFANRLTPYWLGGPAPAALPAGVREVGLQCSVFPRDDLLDALRRRTGSMRASMRLELVGPRVETGPPGDFTRIVIRLARVELLDAADVAPLDGPVVQRVSFRGLKTHGAGAELAFDFSTA
jgi:hypothetical protein